MTAKKPELVLLVVDDEEDILEILKETLAGTCDKIVAASNGRVALDIVMKGLRPDAILSDLNMPKLNGLQLLEELNQLGINAPFIFLSGYGSGPTIAASVSLGGFSFMEKPFDLDELKKTVEFGLETGSKIKELELKILELRDPKHQAQKAIAEKQLEKLLKVTYPKFNRNKAG